MNEFFNPYGVISTEYILPAAAVISCGARLHDYAETGEEPCVTTAKKISGQRVDKTIFQFHSETTTGEKVKDLLLAYKQIDFDQPCKLPESHNLRLARKVLLERSRLHVWFQKLMSEPIIEHHSGFGTSKTPLAAALSVLGFPIVAARRVTERQVFFYFDENPAMHALVAAFYEPWGEYTLDQDHPLYQCRGALENRDSLIILLKRASVRVEIKQGGKRFFLPLNASKEKLTEMTTKLNQ